MNWNNLQDARIAVITELASRAPNGFLGRTSIMKLCYFLQELRDVPLGYNFTLYYYGPFDSDVLSNLGSAEALQSITSETVYHLGGYGYQIKKGEGGDAVVAIAKDFIHKHQDSLTWVLSEFGSHNPSDLELESTIVFVDREFSRKPESITLPDLAKRVRDVKPRFSEEDILEKTQLLYDKKQ